MGNTNVELLKAKIDESGYKLQFLADRCGVTYPSLKNRLNGSVEFRVDEMRILSELLRLNDVERNAIFFAQNVDNSDTE